MKRAPKIEYSKIVLGIIGFTGILALAVVAPNCVKLLRSLSPKQKHQKQYLFNKTIEKLERQKLIKISLNQRNQKVVRLTNLGKHKLKEYRLENLVIEKPKKWDRKYRLIIFDIKEWKRQKRDRIRQWLEKLGFVRLQNSVWVYPYDCQEVISLLKANYQIGKEVLYVEANYLENDWQLKKIFGLS